MIEKQNIEDILRHLLLSKIEVRCKHQLLKKGKLQFYSVKAPHIILSIITDTNQQKKLILPCPFSIKQSKGKVTFSYQIEDIHLSTTSFLWQQVMRLHKKPSKYLNEVITITTHD